MGRSLYSPGLVIDEQISLLVLGVIDRVGRPDSRSRPKSGRDPDFSGVVTGARVATRIFFGVATQSGRDPK